ncbi:MAG: hypothetical protein RIS56_2238 [Verrucomicrobiota bacterium]|jgi:hypothetical protein
MRLKCCEHFTTTPLIDSYSPRQSFLEEEFSLSGYNHAAVLRRYDRVVTPAPGSLPALLLAAATQRGLIPAVGLLTFLTHRCGPARTGPAEPHSTNAIHSPQIDFSGLSSAITVRAIQGFRPVKARHTEPTDQEQPLVKQTSIRQTRLP